MDKSDKATAKPSPAPKAGASALVPLEEARRMGSFAAIAGWVFGLIGGVVLCGLMGARPVWLFGVVGVPIVLVSYFLGTFAGGRIARSYVRGFLST